MFCSRSDLFLGASASVPASIKRRVHTGSTAAVRKRQSSHHHLSLNRESRWSTTDDFVTSFLHFPLFSTALWDLANSRPVHSLMLSSHLFLCLPCLLLPFAVPCKMVLAGLDERETWRYHCSLRLFTMVRSGDRKNREYKKYDCVIPFAGYSSDASHC